MTATIAIAPTATTASTAFRGTRVRISRHRLAAVLEVFPQAREIADVEEPETRFFIGEIRRSRPMGPGMIRLEIPGISGREFHRRCGVTPAEMFNAFCAMRERQELDSM